MPQLFGCTGAGTNGGANAGGTAGTRSKRGRLFGDDELIPAMGAGSSNEELRAELREVRELATMTAQLASIHDTRLRELGVLFRVLMFPKTHRYAVALEEEDKRWKNKRTTYFAAKSNATEGMEQETIGSKHLQLGAAMLQLLFEDSNTKQEAKDFLQAKWERKDTSTPAFLEGEVHTAKWRMARDGKHGILEFKFTEDLSEIEKEFIRVATETGAKLKTGVAARGERVRELDKRLEGTWSRGTNGR